MSNLNKFKALIMLSVSTVLLVPNLFLMLEKEYSLNLVDNLDILIAEADYLAALNINKYIIELQVTMISCIVSLDTKILLNSFYL